MNRVVILAATHLFAIALGVGLGAFVVSDRGGRAVEAANQNTRNAADTNAVQNSRATMGDNAASEKALLDRVAFLDDVLAKKGGSDDAYTYYTEKAITLARLASIAEARGEMDRAAELMDRAEAECPATRLRACSADDLRRLAAVESYSQRRRGEGRLRSEGR